MPKSTTKNTKKSASKELLTIVVPCLNEENNIGTTIEAIHREAPHLPVDIRVIMVDDGSTDGTRDRMKSLATRFENTECVVNPSNLGLGRTLVQVYDYIPPRSWVTVIPGDNEIVFESIHNFLDVRDKYDLILGYLQNSVIRTVTRRWASDLFSKVARTLYGFEYQYLNGLKMYRIEVFKGIEIVSSGHATNAELIAKAILRNPELRIGEVPFITRGRASGGSKAFQPASIARAVKDTYRGFRSVREYRKMVISNQK